MMLIKLEQKIEERFKPAKEKKSTFAVPVKCAIGISTGRRTWNTRFKRKLGWIV
jgi:hypothetical protein